MPNDPALRRVEQLGAQFEETLRGFVSEASATPIPNLHDAMAYALGTDVDESAQRGKRLRPALCLLTAEALGADLELARPFAVAIELMHTFCLVHDDIEDGDLMRRGRPTVWSRYGQAHAINVGDYLLVQTYRALTDWGTPKLDGPMRLRLLRILTAALERTHIGQAMDINARGRGSISVERYMELAREKTGFYLAAPIQGAAVVAGADEELIATIGRMAEFLGPLFQIVDDIIDLTEGKGREAVGSDVREGKRSFLVAHTSAHCTAREAEKLLDILDRPREETSDQDVGWVAGLFERHGAIEAGRAQCAKLYQESLTHLDALPEPLRLALGPVLESLARRKH